MKKQMDLVKQGPGIRIPRFRLADDLPRLGGLFGQPRIWPLLGKVTARASRIMHHHHSCLPNPIYETPLHQRAACFCNCLPC
jgi:hypothetical protein